MGEEDLMFGTVDKTFFCKPCADKYQCRTCLKFATNDENLCPCCREVVCCLLCVRKPCRTCKPPPPEHPTLVNGDEQKSEEPDEKKEDEFDTGGGFLINGVQIG